MFERFTDRARRVVVEAQEEARQLRHNCIGTEHLLLGLLREGQGVAAKALLALDVSLDAVREQVAEMVGEGSVQPYSDGHIPFTPCAKKVLQRALREALQLGHNYIGTEHILLGVIAEGDGVAVRVLAELGADAERVRQQVALTWAQHGLGGEQSTFMPVQGSILTSMPVQTGRLPGRGSRAQIAELYARLAAAESRVSALSAEVDGLRGLLARHGIDSADPGAGEAAAD